MSIRRARSAASAASALLRGGQSLAALPAQAAAELAALERELGGRQALITALTYAPPHKDIRYMLGLLGDPDNAQVSLADLCYAGRIMPGQLVDALAKGSELRARLLATQLVHRRLPDVVGDVMLKAAPYEDICPQCQGLGTTVADPTPDQPNPAQEMCPGCLGHGRLRYDADGTCRELALEMGGLIGKSGGGVQIVNTQQTLVASGGGGAGLEAFQELLDAVLFGQDGGRTTAPDGLAAGGGELPVEGELVDQGAPAAGEPAGEPPTHDDANPGAGADEHRPAD